MDKGKIVKNARKKPLFIACDSAEALQLANIFNPVPFLNMKILYEILPSFDKRLEFMLEANDWIMENVK